MRIAQALAAAAAHGIARLDAQLLLLHALGRRDDQRAWLLAHDDAELAPVQQAAFMSMCERRRTGEPVAYLVGHKEFYGMRLAVDRRVLVPRPDTETLVDWALETLGARSTAPQPGDADRRPRGHPRILDLGTGSGAIALAIKKHRPDAHVEAVDRDPAALEVARSNGDMLSLEVEFRQASWLEGAGAYDLIVSNPPYVAAGDEHLAHLSHEPPCALASGPAGLDDIRAIVRQAGAHLHAGGWLLLEHGWDQAAKVRSLFEQHGFTQVGSRRDLGGIERCTGGRRPELG